MRTFISLTFRLVMYMTLLCGVIALVIFASVPLARLETPGDLPRVDNSRPVALDNANVITMVGNEVLKKRQLLIRDGRIMAIRPAGSPVSPEYRLIDANGNWVIPGLFDMHVHVYDRKYQVLGLSYGVTSVRNMAGFPFHLRWKRELENGEWLGSNLFSTSPILNASESADPLSQVGVDDPVRAAKLVARYKQEGWDYIKVYEDMAADVYAAVIREAKKQDIPVVGHLPYSVIEKDYRLGTAMRTLEHAEEIYDGPLEYRFDNAKLDATAQQLNAMNATVTPTLMIFDQLTRITSGGQQYVDTLSLQYLNPFVKFVMDNTDGQRWLVAGDKWRRHNVRENEFLRHIVSVLYRNRVNLILGSDSGAIYAVQGIATHDEMKLMLDAGLSPWAILRAATVNAARAAGVENTLGTVETGKAADLVMVSGNPLFDISILREPRAVIKNGQYLDRERILVLRVSSLNQSSPYLTLGRLLEFQLYRLSF
ncbi:MAG: amidohydrolase family protein [Thiogranum sp.]